MRTLKIAAALIAMTLLGPQAVAQDQPPFGQEPDVNYASDLWAALAQAGLVGPDTIQTMAYEGTDPHGVWLELLVQPVSVDDHEGLAIVKKNYTGEDLTREEVLETPDEHLASITVMYRRAEGYDPENQNWFWAKYNLDGTLQSSPQGLALGGPVVGCIQCHSGASGDDYVFSYDLPQSQ